MRYLIADQYALNAAAGVVYVVDVVVGADVNLVVVLDGELSVFLVFFEPAKIRSPVRFVESLRVRRLSVDSAFGISNSCKVK